MSMSVVYNVVQPDLTCDLQVCVIVNLQFF